MTAPARTRMNTRNVLVIGSGAAGMRAAIAANEAGTEVFVMEMPRLGSSGP